VLPVDGYTKERNGIGACQLGVGQNGLIKFEKNVKLFRGKRGKCPFKFKYETARDFKLRPEKAGYYRCSFAEIDGEFRMSHVFIKVFAEQIFPKEQKE